jgi:hypothetical protein
MKEIELTRDKVALVDDEVFEMINKKRWYATHFGYASRKSTKKEKANGAPSVTYMHRQITNAGKEKDVDHINGNRLDNRKENLRVCSRSENLRNQKRKSPSKTSVYKGVCLVKNTQKWRSYIYYDEKAHHLGTFDSETKAALAYNKSALEHYGEYALINKVIS